MDLARSSDSGTRFAAYVEGLVSVVGHADRATPLHDYCVGLVMPGERKSVEPMAAKTAPAGVGAQHQKLLHFVNTSPWSDEKMLAKVRKMVMPSLERHGGIEAWIVDDTGIPKKGRHSVGVGRQYCGQLGKQENCQVAVSLSIANHHASLPIAYRLYLPETWTKDGPRRRKVGVPEDVRFMTKPEIALEQIGHACEAGIARGVVLTDPAYGNDARFRHGISALGLMYSVGVQSTTLVWIPGSRPVKARRGGRERNRDLVSVKDLALGLSATAWRTIKWREGTNEWLSSRFAHLRVRVGDRHQLAEEGIDEWLLIEWPKGEKEPSKYWLSTLPEIVSFRDLVDTTKLRWRVERDYQELKQEVGLGHFEGRGWRGFHHHATLCIAAYGFLISERETIPPSEPRSPEVFPELAVPSGYRPRGSPIAA
jgi:SRSO17 transposase